MLFFFFWFGFLLTAASQLFPDEVQQLFGEKLSAGKLGLFFPVCKVVQDSEHDVFLPRTVEGLTV